MPRCLRMSRMTDGSSILLMILIFPLHFGQIKGSTFPAFAGTGSNLLNQSCPAFPECLFVSLWFKNAGDSIILAFLLPFSPCDVAVISVVPHHLLSPVRDVRTHSRQPFHCGEDLVCLSVHGRIDDLPL